MVGKNWNKWRATWQENGKQCYKYFINKEEAIICENENREKIKERNQKEKESKTIQQRRAEGLLRNGHCNECESKAIRKLVKLLENNWNIKLIIIYIMESKLNRVLSKLQLLVIKHL